MADSMHSESDATTSREAYSSNSGTSFSLKVIAVAGYETTYSHLEESFIPKKGRGRRRAPPTVLLTNRLLLQLRTLQKDNNMTRDDVGEWFEKLFPESDYPITRVGALLGRAEKKIQAMFDSGENLTAYLDARIDLDFVSTSLSERGVKLGQLMGKKTFEATAGPVTHELVLDLEGYRKKEQLPRNFTCSWIKKLTGMTEDDSKIIRSLDKLMTCRRNNIKILFLKESGNTESSEESEKKAIAVFQDRLGLSSIKQEDIEIAHRIGKKTGENPRPIIVKFVSMKTRRTVMQKRRNLKGSGIVITDDMTKKNYHLYRKASDHPGVSSAWTSEGRIFVRDLHSKTHRINSESDLSQLSEGAVPHNAPGVSAAVKRGRTKLQQWKDRRAGERQGGCNQGSTGSSQDMEQSVWN